MPMDEAGVTGGELRHLAFLYRNADEYVAAVREYLTPADNPPVSSLIAVSSSKQVMLRQALGPSERDHVTFADMGELGRNPARILPAMQAFIDAHRPEPTLVVTEPVWRGRSGSEIREIIRHESLINLAFADASTTALCLYDAAGLRPDVVSDACLTHPAVIAAGRRELSPEFTGAGMIPVVCDDPLPHVPQHAAVLAYQDNLRPVRDLISAHARKAEVPSTRAVDLVLAVSEIAANTLRHTDSGGTVSVWQTGSELICQIHDSGHISDPLAGRRAPDPDHPGGHGLWLVHQVCDLAEVRSDVTGTRVRLHMRLGQVPQNAPRSPGHRLTAPNPGPVSQLAP